MVKTGTLPLGIIEAAVLISFAACVMCIGAIMTSWMHAAPAGRFWRELGISFTAMVLSRRYLLQILKPGEQHRFLYASGLMMAAIIVLAFLLGLSQFADGFSARSITMASTGP